MCRPLETELRRNEQEGIRVQDTDYESTGKPVAPIVWFLFLRSTTPRGDEYRCDQFPGGVGGVGIHSLRSVRTFGATLWLAWGGEW